MTYKIRVYKIVNDVDDRIYVGSTKQRLPKRFSGHKKNHNWLNGNPNYCT